MNADGAPSIRGVAATQSERYEMGTAMDDHADLRQAKKNGHTQQSVPIFISGPALHK